MKEFQALFTCMRCRMKKCSSERSSTMVFGVRSRLCVSCDPSSNTKCIICNIIRPNTSFHRPELARKMGSRCKICKPFALTSNAKKRREADRKNPEWLKRVSARQNKRIRERKSTDLQFRIKTNLRNRISNIMNRYVKKGVFVDKGGSAVKDLGCSIEHFVKHIESLWSDGMSWKNYGNRHGQWSIDHILPLSLVDLTDRDQFLKVCHYTNLRPMWHIDNIKKGNRIL